MPLNDFVKFFISMDLEEKTGNIFLTFVNVDTGKVNVIFKLKDSNNYGIVMYIETK